MTFWVFHDRSRRGSPWIEDPVTARAGASLPIRNGGRKKGALTVDTSPVLPRLGIDSPRPAPGAFRESRWRQAPPPVCDALIERAGAPVGAPSRDTPNARGHS